MEMFPLCLWVAIYRCPVTLLHYNHRHRRLCICCFCTFLFRTFEFVLWRDFASCTTAAAAQPALTIIPIPFSLPWIHGRLTAGIGVRYSNRFRQSWTVLVTSIHGTARLLAKLSWYGMCYFPWRAFLCVLCSSFVKGFSFRWWWWLWWMMGWDSKNRISFHPLLYPKNTPYTVLMFFTAVLEQWNNVPSRSAYALHNKNRRAEQTHRFCSNETLISLRSTQHVYFCSYT